MKRSLLLAVSVFLASPTPSWATAAPLYEPDPNGSGYTTNVAQARPRSYNGRSGGNIYAPIVRGGKTKKTAGSESYNYAVPVLHLAGRNGFDVDLTLYYNSRVWTINKSSHTATFNGDRDFPSYGFRLNFGYLEYDGTDDFYTLTEADGTKRQLNFVTSTQYYSNDATYIRLAQNDCGTNFPAVCRKN